MEAYSNLEIIRFISTALTALSFLYVLHRFIFKGRESVMEFPKGKLALNRAMVSLILFFFFGGITMALLGMEDGNPITAFYKGIYLIIVIIGISIYRKMYKEFIDSPLYIVRSVLDKDGGRGTVLSSIAIDDFKSYYRVEVDIIEMSDHRLTKFNSSYIITVEGDKGIEVGSIVHYGKGSIPKIISVN